MARKFNLLHRITLLLLASVFIVTCVYVGNPVIEEIADHGSNVIGHPCGHVAVLGCNCF